MITEKEITEYYDEIYSKKGLNAMRPLSYYRQVFRYLNAEKDKNLLGVLCIISLFVCFSEAGHAESPVG